MEWVKDLNLKDPPAHQLRRVLSEGLQRELLTMENLIESRISTSLDALLDDSTPEELLSRLEQTLLTVQAWTLRDVFQRTPKEEHEALRSLLQHSSWKSGRKCGNERWGETRSAEFDENLSVIFKACRDNPFAGRAGFPGFIVRRDSRHEVLVDWVHSPFVSPHPDVQSVASELCPLQIQWTRGYVYAINTLVSVEFTPPARPGAPSELAWRFHG